jgi:peptidoglycan/xylan/chitin deacetylase (PgdA/CDA1 family)
MSLPPYYSSLGPFRDAFRTGQPILTYHHVGPRRRGARLKGRYVSPRLFARQVTELLAAGFSTASFNPLTTDGSAPPRPVFLTFDDGFRDVFEHALPVLRQHRCQGIVFLLSDLLGRTNEWQQRVGDCVEPLMDEAQVREWLAAGQQIGSHTRTHPRLTQLTPEVAREEITGSRKALEDRFGRPVTHFCYPYGDWNDRVRELVIEAGYTSACTTEPGVNTAATDPFALRRITARYPSRSWKNLWPTVASWLRADRC